MYAVNWLKGLTRQPTTITCSAIIIIKWLNGKHLLRAIIQPVKIDSEARNHLPSRNWYQFANPERIAGLVSPEHVERHRELNPVPPDLESTTFRQQHKIRFD